LNTNAPIVAPSFRGEICNPVLFRRNLFPKLLEFTGDQSGRVLIKKYQKKTGLVEGSDETAFKEDYAKALNWRTPLSY
jgi:CTP:molybdopterin cytidylyltransferase MocA